ncbi:MAG TPA: radical SAM domain protein, coenzyme PQQ synthesis protein E, partial [Nitrospiria bacterium]|nr:radical SAM domain protein, coenzyme PQQ synthesis protein E [Nitrospiria bacterium]
DSPVFLNLRDPDRLEGRCGRCEFRTLCAGCRARAYGMTGDYLTEEPFCLYQPGVIEPALMQDLDTLAGEPLEGLTLPWSDQARGVLERIPFVLRGQVIRMVEGYALSHQISFITPEIMQRARESN